MSFGGRTVLTAVILAICSLVVGHAGKGVARGDASSGVADEGKARAFTDGRLQAGHLETIRVTGFPGKGVVEVSLFPSAICEDGCGAHSYRVGRTNERGAGKFRVRIPGTFFDIHDRHVYFRNGEQVEVSVTWTGPDRAFAVASVQPKAIFVRNHRARHG